MTAEKYENLLVAQAKSGSSEAFARLVSLHQQAVRNFLRRLCANSADADDLAQDTFVAAWENLKQFSSGTAFRPWLHGIAYRAFLSARRSWFRRLRRETIAVENTEVIASPTAQADARLDLTRALQSLSKEQRACVALCLAADFSHSEAAAALNIPLGTVKSHVQRGRAQILAALGGNDG